MPALLDWLEDKLAENIQLLSSYEKYKREVLGGSLDWSPMHTSDQFWRENTAAFEEKDFQILRVLLKLVESSREVQTSGSKVEDGLFISGRGGGSHQCSHGTRACCNCSADDCGKDTLGGTAETAAVFLQAKTLAVGCSDVGYFITFHPIGRQIVSGVPPCKPHSLRCKANARLKYCAVLLVTDAGTVGHADLRGKELVMRLMMHPDPSVQRQALLCVQKIMLARDKLEFMNAQNEA